MANSFSNGVGSFFEAYNTYNSNTQGFAIQLNNTYDSASKIILAQFTQNMKVGSATTDLNILQRFVFGAWSNQPLELQSRKTGENTSVSSVYANTFNSYSDHRLKTNIQTLGEDTGVNKVRVVQYDVISDNTKHYGVIAHELAEIYPELVSGSKDAEAMQSVSYIELIPLCINDIQKLQKENELLRSRLESLELKLAIKN